MSSFDSEGREAQVSVSRGDTAPALMEEKAGAPEGTIQTYSRKGMWHGPSEQ